MVFGQVIAGLDALDEVERTNAEEGDEGVTITIVGCGEYVLGETESAGYLLNVPDHSFEGFTTVFHAWPRVRIVAGNAAAVDKFTESLKFVRCVVVSDEDIGAAGQEGTHVVVDVTVYAKQVAPPTYDSAKCVVAVPVDVLQSLQSWCTTYRPHWVLDRRGR